MGTDRLGKLPCLPVQFRPARQSCRDHVPVYITTGRQSVQKCAIDVLDGLLQVTLDDAVELERLSSSDLQRTIPMFIGNLVHNEPLLRSTHSYRHTHTNHKRVSRLDALDLPLVPNISIVLLVNTVELGELSVGSRRERRRLFLAIAAILDFL